MKINSSKTNKVLAIITIVFSSLATIAGIIGMLISSPTPNEGFLGGLTVAIFYMSLTLFSIGIIYLTAAILLLIAFSSAKKFKLKTITNIIFLSLNIIALIAAIIFCFIESWAMLVVIALIAPFFALSLMALISEIKNQKTLLTVNLDNNVVIEKSATKIK